MDAVFRALAIYAFLLLIFRIAGKRTLSQITTFDFVLLLIIAEVTQSALIGQDYSLTNAFILIVTLLGTDIGLSFVKQYSPKAAQALDGMPVLIVQEGRLLHDRMDKARVDEGDIMNAAREAHGLERLEQVKYAVLERSGKITIIPRG